MLHRQMCICILVLFVSVVCAEDASRLWQVGSPDGNVSVGFTINSSEGIEDGLFWSVKYKGKTVLKDSQISFGLEGEVPLDRGFKLIVKSQYPTDKRYQRSFRKRRILREGIIIQHNQ